MPTFSRSSAWTLLGKYKAPFPGRIPISRPSGTLLSWKKDAVDCKKTKTNATQGLLPVETTYDETLMQQGFLVIYFGSR